MQLRVILYRDISKVYSTMQLMDERHGYFYERSAKRHIPDISVIYFSVLLIHLSRLSRSIYATFIEYFTMPKKFSETSLCNYFEGYSLFGKQIAVTSFKIS